jgi:hypothetical protein
MDDIDLRTIRPRGPRLSPRVRMIPPRLSLYLLGAIWTVALFLILVTL